jgi:hypothetical protein
MFSHNRFKSLFIHQFKRLKRQKEQSMNNVLSKASTRLIGMLTVIAIIATLITACGGGGSGGNSTPPGVALPQTTITVAGGTSYTIQQDQSSATATINWTTSPGTVVSLRTVAIDGTTQTVASGTSGPASVPVPVGTTTYQLYSGNTAVGQTVVATGSCVPGTQADTFGVCRTPSILHYTDKHVAIKFGYPGLISLTGTVWSPATNNTSYQVGVLKLYNCQISEASQYNGEFLELCQAAVDGDLHIISHNVVTNTLTNYVGMVPAGYEVVKTGAGTWSIGPKWHALNWKTAPFVYMNGWMSTADGGYIYTDFTDDRVLRYQDQNGMLSVIYTSTQGSFSVMNTISN